MECLIGDYVIFIVYKPLDTNGKYISHVLHYNYADYAFRVYAKFTSFKFVNLEGCWLIKAEKEGSAELVRDFCKEHMFNAVDFSNENKGVQYLKDKKAQKKDVGWRFLKVIADKCEYKSEIFNSECF